MLWNGQMLISNSFRQSSSSLLQMGIPACVKLPKSTFVVVAVYILCAAINSATKALRRVRFGLPGSSSHGNRASLAAKGGRAAQKTTLTQGEFSRKSKTARGALVCAVCLGEVEEGDEIRELRECLHGFHKVCLDGWVKEGYFTCPLCRTQFSMDQSNV